MKKRKTIIIGAGIGGLAAAIILAKQGFDVTIYEKNKRPGGRCGQISKQGHIFDSGPTMYLFPKIFSNFFSSINEDPGKYFKLIRTEPIYKLNYPDKSHIILTSNSRKMHDQLEKLEQGSYLRFLDYLKNAKNHYDIAINQITAKSLDHPLDYFNFKNLYSLLKTNSIMNHHSYTQKFFKHPHLNAAFTFQDSYLSLNPFQSPAIYSLFTYSELTEGSYLPEGGMYQVILALGKISKKNKVKIKYNCPVEKILFKNNKADRIILKSGISEPADYIIINSDISYSYLHLLPEKSPAQKLLKKKYSCSAVIFHWGLNKIYSQLKTHNLFFSDNYEKGFEQVINHSEPPPNPHFYIQAPARTDPTRAPKNHDTLTIIVPINHLYPSRPVEWTKYKNSVRKYIINRLEKTGLRNIEDHIKFEISRLPQEWQNNLNLTHGSIYGLHHNLGQLGYLRPHRRHAKYNNLYFTGSGTHPGSGLPTVLLSAQFTGQMIINEAAKNPPFNA